MAGLAGLCLFAFGLFFKAAQAYQGLGLMTLALLLLLAGRARRLLGDPLFLLSFIFISYLALRTAQAWSEFPALHEEILDAARRWSITGFLAVFIGAFWCSRRPALTSRLLLLSLVGLLARILLHFDWNNARTVLHAFLSGDARATFGFSANNLGTWCAVATLGLAIYARPFCGPARCKARFASRASLWLGAMVVTFGSLLFSQARGAWLAFAVVLPVALLYQALVHRGRRRQGVGAFALVGALILVLGIMAGQRLVEQRLSYERGVITQVMAGDIKEEMPATSTGIRIELYKIFLERFRERPVAGWGPGLARELISGAEMDAIVRIGFIHFHNLIFDILIQLGLTGGVLFGAMVCLLAASLWRGYRQGAASPELFTCLAGGSAIFLIAGLASEPMLNSTGSFFVAFAGGLAYSFRLRERENEGRPAPFSAGPAVQHDKGSS